ncbi:MAG: flavodoxin family protein [Anaerolineales bacterium]
MNAHVIYDSAYGNTAKIAQAIGAGLAAQHTVTVLHLNDAAPDDLATLDLLVLGSPTQALNYTEAMGEFLGRVGDLPGVPFATFDTRISIEHLESRGTRWLMRYVLRRYAARPLANVLTQKGARQIAPPAGFFVTDTEGPLLDGELARATAWAEGLAVPERPTR